MGAVAVCKTGFGTSLLLTCCKTMAGCLAFHAVTGTGCLYDDCPIALLCIIGEWLCGVGAGLGL